MQHTRRSAHRALSVFLACALVFTCNSATFQPLALAAQKGDAPAAAGDAGGLELACPASAEDAPAGGATSGAGAETTTDAFDEPVDALKGDGSSIDGDHADRNDSGLSGSGESDAADPVESARELTDVDDAVRATLDSATYTDANGRVVQVEAGDDGRLDLSSFDPSADEKLALRFVVEVRPGSHAGDTVSLSVPADRFGVEGAKPSEEARFADPGSFALATADSKIVATLGAAFEQATAPLSLGMQVFVELRVDALGSEPRVVTVPLLGGDAAEVVLPAKPALAGGALAAASGDAFALVAPLVGDVALGSASALLEKEWRDNNDAARPWNEIATDGTLAVYFTIGLGRKTKLDEGTMGRLGLDALPPIIAKSAGTSRTTYACDGLPATVGGQVVSYAIEEDEAKAKAHGYVQRMSDGVLHNIKTTAFRANVEVRDGDGENGVHRDPGAGAFALYRASDGTPVNAGDATWTFDAATGLGSYAVANLPLYELDGSEIAYYAKVPEPADPTVDHFMPEYDNAKVPNQGTNVSECRNGGTVNLTLVGSTAYRGTKVWLDDGADPADRPDATFYLWRYTDKDGSGYAQASQVRDDGNNLISVPLAGDDKGKDAFDIVVANLPKYDPKGYPYVYLVCETLGSGPVPYEQVFGSVDGDGAVTDTLPEAVSSREGADRSVYNGGTLSNRRTGTVETSQMKTWKASAYQNQIADAEVTLTLQSRPAGSADDAAWSDTSVSKQLTGFKAEIMTMTAESSAPRYDALGRELEYRWTETSVKENGVEKLQVGDDGARTFLLACNDAANAADPRAPERFTSSVEPLPADPSRTWIVNRIQGTVDYTVDKLWNQQRVDADGNAVYGKTPPKEGASIAIELFQNGASMSPARQYVMDGTPDEVNCETEPYHIYVDDLPKYDEEGRSYTYVAEEVRGYETWHSTYAHDIDDRVTTIKNDPTGPGAMIRVGKVWIDDGDVDHRYPVFVEVYKKGQAAGAPVGSAVLSAQNNWWAWVGVDDGTSYTDYELKEVALKGAAQDFAPNDTTYPGLLTVTTDHHIYRVDYGQNDKLGMLTVTNKRIGVIDLTVEKEWLDRGADVAMRPGAKLKLVCDEYPNAVTGAADANDGKVAFADGNSLPIRDASGKQTSAVQTVASDKGTYTFFNLPKYDETGKVVHYSIVEEWDDASQAASRDYVLAVDPVDYKVGEVTHTHDEQAVKVTNSRTGSKSVEFHKEWIDAYAYENGKRPDIYLALWQRSDGVNGGAPVKYDGTGFKEHQWKEREGQDATGQPFDGTKHWTATFAGMPKYDATGAEITYFAHEFTNVDASAFDYTSVTYKNGDGSAATVGNGGVVELGSPDAPAMVLKEGGAFVNAIEKSVVVEGKKFWKSIPDGFPLAQLPSIAIHLDQCLGDKVVKQDIASTDRLVSIAGTNDYSFSMSKTGRNDVGADALPKYDDKGNLYAYQVREEFTSLEPAGITWEKLYAPSSMVFSLSNVFNTGAGNTGSLVVSKEWANHPVDAPYPAATFKLHRLYKKADPAPGADVSEVVATKTLRAADSADGKGSVRFDNLLVYAPDGQKYRYCVEEEAVNGYSISASSSAVELNVPGAGQLDAAVAVSVKNDYDQAGSIELAGAKAWDDYGNAFGLRPGSVQLSLTRTAAAQPGQGNAMADPEAVTLTEGSGGNLTWDKATNPDTWTYTITGLDRYAPNGMPWVYKVTEAPDAHGLRRGSHVRRAGVG